MSDVESDPEEGLFYRSLPDSDDELNKLFHRYDESASLTISASICSYLLDQNHQATINSNSFNPTRVVLFKLNRLGGGTWSVVILLKKIQLLYFMDFHLRR